MPGDALLGGEEKLQRKLERARSGQRSGASGALATFEITRPTVGASALGIAQAAYEWTLEYLHGRTEEGRPLLQEQRIQQVLADVATEIEAARLLVWRAAWMGRNGVPMTGGQGSMSKLKGGDVAMWATTALMDLVGPAAQSTEYPLEKWFRDAKIYQIFEGTAQIQRLVIARMQTAEYAERLQFAKDVAAETQNGNGSGVVSQAPGNAPSETPASSRDAAGPGLAGNAGSRRCGGGARPLACAAMGHAHAHSHSHGLDARRAGNRSRMAIALGDQRRAARRDGRRAASSPTRSRCWRTPGTCSRTSARSRSACWRRGWPAWRRRPRAPTGCSAARCSGRSRTACCWS